MVDRTYKSTMRLNNIIQYLLSDAERTDLLPSEMFIEYPSDNERATPESHELVLQVENIRNRRKVDMVRIYQQLQKHCLEINAIDTTSPQYELQFKGLPERVVHLFLKHHIEFSQIECIQGRCNCHDRRGPHCCAESLLDCIFTVMHTTWSLMTDQQRQSTTHDVKSCLWQNILTSRVHVDNQLSRQEMTMELQPWFKHEPCATTAVLSVIQDYFNVNLIVYHTSDDTFRLIRSKRVQHYRPFFLLIQSHDNIKLIRRNSLSGCWLWREDFELLQDMVNLEEISALKVNVKQITTPILKAITQKFSGKDAGYSRVQLEEFVGSLHLGKIEFETVKSLLQTDQN